MNAVFALMLLLISGRIGYIKAGRLRKRKKTLRSIECDIRRILERMSVCPEPYPGLLSRFSQETMYLWEFFLQGISPNEDIGTVFEHAMEDAAKCRNGFELLTKDEWLILSDFGRGLSAAELHAQKENAALALKRVRDAIDAVDGEIQQKGRIFESLGFLMGLALALLVI